MIELGTKPRLAAKVRLRHDAIGDRHVLLVPEKGLVLNRTALSIVHLCTGENSVESMIEQLSHQHADVSKQQLRAEVVAFLQSLDERGLLEVAQ